MKRSDIRHDIQRVNNAVMICANKLYYSMNDVAREVRGLIKLHSYDDNSKLENFIIMRQLNDIQDYIEAGSERVAVKRKLSWLRHYLELLLEAEEHQ